MLVAAVTGGYFAYEHFAKPKPASSPAARTGASASSGSSTGAKVAATGNVDSADPPPGPAVPAVREIKVPDLAGLTPDQATAKLTTLGFRDAALVIRDDVHCAYDDEKNMVAQGTICNQGKSPGAVVASSAKIDVAIEHDTYDSGGVHSGSAWRRMPAIEGLSLPAAQALLRDKGFSDDEFEVERVAACRKDTVCVQNPRAGIRKKTAVPGRIQVGS